MSKLPTKKSANNGKMKSEPTPPIKQTIERVRKLVDLMLESMAVGLNGEVSKEDWVRIFGSKESAVANLLKLVQVIGVLSNQADGILEKSEDESPHTLSREEMALLTDWLNTSQRDA